MEHGIIVRAGKVRNRILIPGERVRALIVRCVADMSEWGYRLPAEIEWRRDFAKRRIGQARLRRACDGPSVVLLGHLMLENDADDAIRNTIYHELAHLAAGWGAGHGPKWQRIARDVTRRTGLVIKRLADSAEHPWIAREDAAAAKYAFRCRKCGAVVTRMRRSAFTESYDEVAIGDDGTRTPRWLCAKCGGTFERIK